MTGIIIAGGKSSRMGKDKAVLNSSVARIHQHLTDIGCSNIITMCGTEERMEMFEGNCVPDSKDNLARSLIEIIENIDDEIQLVPCDAYLVDAVFLSNISGVPVDDKGSRQPLLARLAKGFVPNYSDKISEVFSEVESCEGGLKARNFNTSEEFKEIESLLQQVDQSL